VLDLATFEYRPSVKPSLPALEMAKNAGTVAERLKILLANDPAKDKAAKFCGLFLLRFGSMLRSGSARFRPMRPRLMKQ